MTYFTILHWITLLVFLLLFVLLVIISKKESNPKIFWSMVFSSFLVTSMLAIFSMFVLDKYTKKGKLINITHKRVLLNETIVFFGQVQNIGRFKIGRCKLEVKIANNALNLNNITGKTFYAPRSGLGSLFTNKKERPSTVVEDFVIAKDLNPGEVRNFSATMPYPPYFQKADIRYKLYCH